jgi:hypothetical protein
MDTPLLLHLQLAELPPPVLRTCLQALAASGASVPDYWESALWEALGQSLPGYNLQVWGGGGLLMVVLCACAKQLLS